MSRRQFRETEVIEILLMQRAMLPCFRCGLPFTLDDLRARNVHKEHLHEIALGGADDPSNCRYSHADPCHAQITSGNGATTAGSSIQRIAKTKPTRADKFAVRKPPIDVPREPRRGFGRRGFERAK